MDVFHQREPLRAVFRFADMVWKMDALMFLLEWYSQQCNGEWEHTYGVKIETLDNPGWALKIDLTGTDLADRAFAPMTRGMEGETNWMVARVDNGRFEAWGGAANFQELLETFSNWVRSYENLT